MKKLLLLFITTTSILAGCVNFNEQKKMEINAKIMQLNDQIANRLDQQTRIKAQRKDLVVKFKKSISRDLSNSEMNDKQNEFQKQMKLLEIQENKNEINNLKDKLEIEKLEQEYLRY